MTPVLLWLWLWLLGACWCDAQPIDMRTGEALSASFMEIGGLLADDVSWVSTSTSLRFSSPSVFVSLPSTDEEFTSSLTIRIRNKVVSRDGIVSFDTRVYQPNDTDCSKEWYVPVFLPSPLLLSWVVAEDGAYNFTNEYLFIGQDTIAHPSDSSSSYDNFKDIYYPTGCFSTLQQDMCTFPVDASATLGTVAQLQTLAHDRFLLARALRVGIGYAKFTLSSHESTDPGYKVLAEEETLSYMAFRSSLALQCADGGLLIESIVLKGVTAEPVELSYQHPYELLPSVFGIISSYNGQNPVGMASFGGTISSSFFKVQEDQCADEEIVHPNAEDITTLIIGEVRSLELSSTVDCAISFRSPYSYAPTLPPTPAPSVLGATNCPTAAPSPIPSAQPSVSQYPTHSPSSWPTRTPTTMPTAVPSVFPSCVPTSNPSEIPTGTPSTLPTMTPTAVPTALPSLPPTPVPSVPGATISPTCGPTATPSHLPTEVPSVCPTVTPTSEPTVTPSMLPTEVPSCLPSSPPTFSPTQIPTYHPTTLPSSIPTHMPSMSPSSAPTVVPTECPSCDPSSTPTEAPTPQPTVLPSFPPTPAPSIPGATNSPTPLPTPEPTSQPSFSQQPSKVPSGSPSSTSTPSIIPSVAPTFFPTTSLPTYQPSTTTGYPSHEPSTSPSASPTVQPSPFPTVVPTPSPTMMPSRPGDTISPTRRPSTAPTRQPSEPPTSTPSVAPTATLTPTVFAANLNDVQATLSTSFPLIFLLPIVFGICCLCWICLTLCGATKVLYRLYFKNFSQVLGVEDEMSDCSQAGLLLGACGPSNSTNEDIPAGSGIEPTDWWGAGPPPIGGGDDVSELSMGSINLHVISTGTNDEIHI